MIAKQKLNPEIWDFWSQTHKAWADGALSCLDPCFQEAAKNTLMIENFVDDSPNIVAAIRTLNPRQDEYLIGYSEDDCDTLLTNRRIIVRNQQSGLHDIYELSDIAACTDEGWWTKTVTITLHNGTVRSYPKLGGAIKEESLNYAISQCRETTSTPQQSQPDSKPPLSKKNNTEELHINKGESKKPRTQKEREPMIESECDMIGSEYPVLQRLIKNRLGEEESLLAFATAVTTPVGNLHWIAGTLELGRVLTAKPYILAVTDKRLLIIQVNRFSRITKEVKEVTFDEIPIVRVRSAEAKTRFLDSIVFKDSFKIETGDGRKYHFRQINSENATMLRDAILKVQES